MRWLEGLTSSHYTALFVAIPALLQSRFRTVMFQKCQLFGIDCPSSFPENKIGKLIFVLKVLINISYWLYNIYMHYHGWEPMPSTDKGLLYVLSLDKSFGTIPGSSKGNMMYAQCEYPLDKKLTFSLGHCYQHLNILTWYLLCKLDRKTDRQSKHNMVLSGQERTFSNWTSYHSQSLQAMLRCSFLSPSHCFIKKKILVPHNIFKERGVFKFSNRSS